MLTFYRSTTGLPTNMVNIAINFDERIFSDGTNIDNQYYDFGIFFPVPTHYYIDHNCVLSDTPNFNNPKTPQITNFLAGVSSYQSPDNPGFGELDIVFTRPNDTGEAPYVTGAVFALASQDTNEAIIQAWYRNNLISSHGLNTGLLVGDNIVGFTGGKFDTIKILVKTFDMSIVITKLQISI
jgi:hypothetical protein